MLRGDEPIRVFCPSTCLRNEASNERPNQVGIQSNCSFSQKPPDLLARNLVCTSIVMTFTILFLFGGAWAQSVSGRFMTTFYSYQQYDTTNTARMSLRGFEAMQLNFGSGDYQLHTYLLATNDFVTKAPNDPLLRAGNLYLEARDLGGMVDLKVGRQPVFQRVGISSFDGISANAGLLGNKVTLVAFGGALPPADETFKLNPSLKDNMVYGAQASYSPFENFKIGGAYVDKTFKPESYYALRRDSIDAPTDVHQVLIDPSSVASQFVSGDVFYYTQGISGYVRLDYDLNYEEWNRTEISLRYSPIAILSADLGYFHRDSRLPFNSIFSVFDHSGTDEYDLGMNLLFTKDIVAYGSFNKIYYTGDQSNQYTIGINCYQFSLNFSHNDGFAGNLNGVSAQFIYPLLDRKLLLIASGAVTGYKILQVDSLPTNHLYSGSLGVTYRPLSLLSLTLQGQVLSGSNLQERLSGLLAAELLFLQ